MAQTVKNLPMVWETWVLSLDWEDSSGGGQGNPLQISCLENPHGQRGLEGYSPWGHKESDTTEQIRQHCTAQETEQVMNIGSPVTDEASRSSSLYSGKPISVYSNVASEMTSVDICLL